MARTCWLHRSAIMACVAGADAAKSYHLASPSSQKLGQSKVMQSAFARFRRPFFVSLAAPSSQECFFRCRDLDCIVLGSLDEQRKKKKNPKFSEAEEIPVLGAWCCLLSSTLEFHITSLHSTLSSQVSPLSSLRSPLFFFTFIL